MQLKKPCLFLFFLTISVTLFSQQDPEAKKILDEFSGKSKSYKAYSASYTLSTENHQNGDNTENKGTLLVKGNKYKMEINNTQIYFDGKDIYNYTKASNEVSIVKPNKKNEDLLLDDPSKLFYIYTKEYKFRYLGETTAKSRNCYEIDLYPYDLKKKYSIIKLLIDKNKLELVSAKAIMKSGVDYTISIDTFNGKAVATEKDFNFDIKTYKGIEVVDLR
jgi:outer membrane lipoprotein-sorting protein